MSESYGGTSRGTQLSQPECHCIDRDGSEGTRRGGGGGGGGGGAGGRGGGGGGRVS